MTSVAGAAVSVTPSSLGMPPAPPRTLWAQQVFTAVLEIRSRLARAQVVADLDHALVAQVLDLTDDALHLLRSRPPLFGPGRLGEWWTGSRVETCWTYVHEAELTLVALAEDRALYASTLARALSFATRLPADDPDRIGLENIAGLPRGDR